VAAGLRDAFRPAAFLLLAFLVLFPAAAPLAAGVVRSSVPHKRRNPLAFLGRFEPRFVADIISELRKVTWPTLAETRYLTVVVAIVAVAVGLFLGGIDLAFGWIVQRLFF